MTKSTNINVLQNLKNGEKHVLPYFEDGQIPFQANGVYNMRKLAPKFIEVPKVFDGNPDFLIRICDNSMEPNIPKYAKLTAIEQSELIQQGETLIVNTRKHGTLVRKVYMNECGTYYILYADTSGYEEIEVMKDDLHIIGKPIEVIYKA